MTPAVTTVTAAALTTPLSVTMDSAAGYAPASLSCDIRYIRPSRCRSGDPFRRQLADLPAHGRADLSVEIHAERVAPGVQGLRLLLERVVAGALHVAEEALEAERPVEARAAGDLHRLLDR